MPEKISFKSLIHDISARSGFSQNISRVFVREMAAVIREGLLEDGVVHLTGLGIFRLREIAERTGRSPADGKPILIPAHRKVYFKPEKRLRELINKQFSHLKPLPVEDKSAGEGKEQDSFNRFLNDSFVDGAMESKIAASETGSSQKSAKAESLTEIKTEKETVYAPTLVQKPAERENAAKVAPPYVAEEEQTSRKGLYATILLILLLVFFYMNYWPQEENPASPRENAPLQAQKTTMEAAPEGSPETIAKPEVAKNKLAKEQGDNKNAVIKRAQRSHLTQRGESLWRLAKRYYDNGYLWPLLYEANHDKIKNPDFMIQGVTLTVPALQGSYDHPTAADREMLARGHLRAYKAYRVRNHREALNHLRVASVYDPELMDKYSTEIDRQDELVLSNVP